jgi:threonine dehydrogenase-like Zn-dependent dehydrogenase
MSAVSTRAIEIADDRRLLIVERPAADPGASRSRRSSFPPPPSSSRRPSLSARWSTAGPSFAAAIELLAEGRIPTEGLISDIVPLERAEAMFQALTAPANERMKVLLKP